MRYLRWVGLFPSLLFVGVLGGLMAPVPSEAGTPTLTLSVDNGSAVSILNTSSSTCTTGTNSETANGYTSCYSVVTGTTLYGGTGTNSRKYTIQPISSGSARLRVADTAGQDKLQLVGVKFVPEVATWATGTDAAGLAPNLSEEHNLTIIYSHAFDDTTINAAGNAGIYKWNVRTSGQFITGPTGGTVAAKKCNTTDGKCDSLNDRVDFTGKGTFSSILSNVDILSPNNSGRSPASTRNQTPLSFTTTGTHLTSSANLSWDGASNTTMGQVDPYYPEFFCTNSPLGTNVDTTSAHFCRPTITLTMKAKLFGPETFQVVNGGDGFCAKCTETITPQQALKIKVIKGILKILNFISNNHPEWLQLRAFIDQATVFLAGINTVNTSEDGQPCPGAQVLGLTNLADITSDVLFFSQDPLNSPGTPAETGTITITKNTGQVTSDTFTFDISGPSSLTETITLGGTNTGSIVVPVVVGTYNVEEINIPEGWSFNNASCGGEGPTTEVVVSVGGNVNCTFNNSPSTGTIKIVKYMDTNAFTTPTAGFTATGNGVSNFNLSANETQASSKTFTGLATGAGGGSRTFTESSFPPIHVDGEDSVWHLDSVVCSLSAATPVAAGQVTLITGPTPVGPGLVGVTVNYVNADQTVTCAFDNHHTHDNVASPFGHNGSGPGGHPATIIEQ